MYTCKTDTNAQGETVCASVRQLEKTTSCPVYIQVNKKSTPTKDYNWQVPPEYTPSSHHHIRSICSWFQLLSAHTFNYCCRRELQRVGKMHTSTGGGGVQSTSKHTKKVHKPQNTNTCLVLRDNVRASFTPVPGKHTSIPTLVGPSGLLSGWPSKVSSHRPSPLSARKNGMCEGRFQRVHLFVQASKFSQISNLRSREPLLSNYSDMFTSRKFGTYLSQSLEV